MGFWWRPTPPGWRPRPTAASATSRPGWPGPPQVLAGLHGVAAEEIASATTKNFLRLFRLAAGRGKLIELHCRQHPARGWFRPASRESHGTGQFIRHRQQGGHPGSPQRHRSGDQGDSPALRPEGLPLRNQPGEGDNEIQLASAGEYKLEAVKEILGQKLVKRGVSLKNLTYGKVEPAAGQSVRQKISLQQGIPAEKAKEIVRLVKDSKKKAQASIQGDTVRISSKDRDELQAIIALLRGKDLGVDLQFTNYRTN